MARPRKRRSVRIGPGCQAFRLPNGWWHVRFYDKAKAPKHKQHALDADDEAIALSRARDQYERWTSGRYDPWKGAARALSVEEACALYGRDHADRFKPGSVRLAQHTARALARSTGRGWDPAVRGSGADPGAVALREITAADVRRFVYRPALSRTSHLSYWRRLKAFMGWAVDRQLLDGNPVEGVPRPKNPRAGLKHLSAAEVDRLLTAVDLYHGPDGPVPAHVRGRDANPTWCRAAFELYATTGLRRGEGAALAWGDVVWPEDSPWGVGYLEVVDEGRVTGRRTKTGKSRRVTMVPQAERLLRRLEAETRRTNSKSETVLKGADGRREVSPHTVSHNFRKYCDWAKLPRVPLHGLRHSFAVDLLLRGASLVQVRDELGHSSVETTQRYLELLPAERMAATARLFAGGPAAGSPNVP